MQTVSYSINYKNDTITTHKISVATAASIVRDKELILHSVETAS